MGSWPTQNELKGGFVDFVSLYFVLFVCFVLSFGLLVVYFDFYFRGACVCDEWHGHLTHFVPLM